MGEQEGNILKEVLISSIYLKSWPQPLGDAYLAQTRESGGVSSEAWGLRVLRAGQFPMCQELWWVLPTHDLI